MLAGSLPAAEKASIYHDGWIDRNKNGVKDPYEDPTLDLEKRIDQHLNGVNGTALDDATRFVVGLRPLRGLDPPYYDPPRQSPYRNFVTPGSGVG